MKKIYLVHCWDGSCEDGWYPWLDNMLKDHDIEFIRFNMPNSSNPKIKNELKLSMIMYMNQKKYQM